MLCLFVCFMCYQCVYSCSIIYLVVTIMHGMHHCYCCAETCRSTEKPQGRTLFGHVMEWEKVLSRSDENQAVKSVLQETLFVGCHFTSTTICCGDPFIWRCSSLRRVLEIAQLVILLPLRPYYILGHRQMNRVISRRLEDWWLWAAKSRKRLQWHTGVLTVDEWHAAPRSLWILAENALLDSGGAYIYRLGERRWCIGPELYGEDRKIHSMSANMQQSVLSYAVQSISTMTYNDMSCCQYCSRCQGRWAKVLVLVSLFASSILVRHTSRCIMEVLSGSFFSSGPMVL